MKTKKIITDIAMTVLLLLLMAYELIGSRAHEWFGTGMLIMFILHHILNRKWTASIRKGRYTPFRILQTLLVLLILGVCLDVTASWPALEQDDWNGAKRKKKYRICEGMDPSDHRSRDSGIWRICFCDPRDRQLYVSAFPFCIF